MTSITGWRVVRRTLTVGAVTAAVLAAMAVTDTGPNVGLVLGAGLALGTVAWAVADLSHLADPAPPAPLLADPDAVAHSDPRVRSLRFNLISLRAERADRLHRLLVELIDDRLTVAHGVDRHTEPRRAAAVLGDDLAAFVDDPDPARSLRRPDRVARIVARIEQL